MLNQNDNEHEIVLITRLFREQQPPHSGHTFHGFLACGFSGYVLE